MNSLLLGETGLLLATWSALPAEAHTVEDGIQFILGPRFK